MLKEYLSSNKRYFDENFEKELNSLKGHKELLEGMKYSCLNGGKRLRPILLFLTLEMLGEKKEKGLYSAIAIEMIHSYSLVHDDLPAMDDDDYRRGIPTTHKKFGEAQGILIGDALLTHAFNVLAEKNKKILTDDQIIKIIFEFSKKSGIEGMVAGQYMDIESEGKIISKDELFTLQVLKTGQLLILPIKVACIISNLEQEKEKHLLAFAEKFGLAFQIRDDILDVEGSFEEMGKKVNKDNDLEKMTFVKAFGIDGAKKYLHKILNECKDILEKNFFDYNKSLFFEFINYMEDRKN